MYSTPMGARRAALLVLAFATATASAAHAQVRSTTVQYGSGAGRRGYDAASFDARYALLKCGNNLAITTEFVPGSLQLSSTYSLDGASYPVPDGLAPTVRDQGQFDGSVRIRGGGTIGTFRSTAGLNSHGCLGDTEVITDLTGYVDVTDKAAVEAFIATLEVVPATNRPYANLDIERAIRRENEAAIKKAEEEKRLAEEAKRAEEAAERKRLAEEELKRLEAEQAKRETDAAAAAEAKAREDAQRGQADAERIAQEQAEAAAREADEAQAQDQNERERAELEAYRQKLEADAKASADADREQDDGERAKREADAQASRQKTEWTDADEADTSHAYWPDDRCLWFDAEGFVHPPSGRHNCDPSFIRQVLSMQRQQLELERARIEAELQARREEEFFEFYGGPTAEGQAVVRGAAELAPVMDALGGAMNAVNNKAPMVMDFEAGGRVNCRAARATALACVAPGSSTSTAASSRTTPENTTARSPARSASASNSR